MARATYRALRLRFKLQPDHTDWSVQAVDRLFEASGGRGIFLNNPIQRAWRDVHAMRAHMGNNPERAAAIFGRSESGLPIPGLQVLGSAQGAAKDH